MIRRTVTEPQLLLDLLAIIFPDSSKTTLRQMLQGGRVRINGEMEKDAKRMLEVDEIVEVGEKSQQNPLPPGLSIVHEDDDVIVVLKAHGLLTVATERELEHTAQAYLNAYLKTRGQARVYPVHRLDRDTSGILVFAKHFDAKEALKAQFAAHSADRVYIAVVEGKIEPPQNTIRTYLAEDRNFKMHSVDGGANAKLAVTHYRTIENAGKYSVLEVTLETGRKNQIRAHLSEAGHPIAGDPVYGSGRESPLGRLGLHARLLGFTHPMTGERLTFTASIPKSFRNLLSGKYS